MAQSFFRILKWVAAIDEKKFDDSAIDAYISTHNVYKSSDIGVDIPAIIKYAREHGISLAAVPQEVINQYTYQPAQLVG